MREAAVCGLDPLAAWDRTPGELLEYIHAARERERREDQRRAQLAYHHAILLGKVFSGNKKPLPAVYEVFPYWTDEERMRIKAECNKQKMQRSAARKGGTE